MVPDLELMRPPRRWSPPTSLLWILTLSSLLALGTLMPVIPYHDQCRSLYEERIRHSREPQVTPEWAASIRSWAETDGCSTCNSTGRISLFFYLRENRWSLATSQRPG